jgi:hypothetical protein
VELVLERRCRPCRFPEDKPRPLLELIQADRAAGRAT